VRVRFVDKVRMLEMLTKHQGLLKERLTVDTKVVYRRAGEEWAEGR
jgi:hypothetical protein